jgi:putative ABC transport system ATP-binding protein
VPPLLVAEHLVKTYPTGRSEVEAISDVSFDIASGELVAIVGPSGCGKSTLLHMCGAMDRPTSGRLTLDGERLDTMDDGRLTRLRRTRIGFVFQFFNLLPTLTLEENVALPLLLAGVSSSEGLGKARRLCDRVGLGDRLEHYPQQLSGGEMQRGAIARALVHEPALIVADEPTGNLDSENGAAVLALVTALNREMGATVLLATHASDVASAAGRVIHIRDGRLSRIDSAQPAHPVQSSRAAL